MSNKLTVFYRVIILFILNECESANILGIVPTASYSHQIAFEKLWKELSLRGHNVTVLTTNPQRNATLINLSEIDLSIGYKFIQEKYNWSQINNQINPFKFVSLFLQMICEITDFYMSLPDVQKLIHDNDREFDVVMVEGHFYEWAIFGELFNAPTILLTSLDASVQLHQNFENPTHPIMYPEIYLPYAWKLSFLERVVSAVLEFVFGYIKNQYLELRQVNIDKYFKNISIPLKDLLKKPSMLFVSVSPLLLLPRAYSPRTIVIGGGASIQEPKQLPKDIEDFLNSAENGAIFFSLGSNAKSENLGEESIRGIIKVFKQLPYKILWKFTNNNLYKIPKNVKIFNWAPQQDVLRHPNIKLFVTQGGIQSLEEAIYFEIPLVGIPVFGDQESNIKKLENNGVLKRVSIKPTLNATELHEAIETVITVPSFKEKIVKLKELSIDQPMSGMDKAIWWTEYVIRHKGKVDHLRNNAVTDIPFYQYYLLDVISFLLLTVFIILGLVYLLLISALKLSVRVFTKKQRYIKKKE